MGTIFKNRIQSLMFFIVAFLLFLEMMPYFWWWSLENQHINYAVRLIICAFFGLHLSSKETKKTGLIILFVITCLLFSFKSRFVSLVLTIPLLCIPFASNNYLCSVFKVFTNIYCVIIGFALIAWTLLLFGLIGPIGTIKPMNINEFDYYTVYPLFLVTHNFFDVQAAFRFSGPFDEPGMVGTFSALLLFANKIDFKNWKTYVLLLSGIVSFSLFFYVVLFIGLVPNIFEKKRFGSIIVVVSVLFAFYSFTKNDEIMGRLIWDRLEWNSEENRLAGSDRTNAASENIYISKRWSNEYWFGLDDYEAYRQVARGSNSYQNVVMQYGMLFLIGYVLFFVLYAWSERCRNSSFFVFLFLFLACIYQRPQVLSCAYFFVYTCLAKREALVIKS